MSCWTGESKEVISHGFLRGEASGFLRCCFKYDKLLLEMLIKLQNGCHITTPRKIEQKKEINKRSW